MSYSPRATRRLYALLLFFALFALLHTPQTARAQETAHPKITNASISPTGTYGAGNDLPVVTITATVTETGPGASGVNPNAIYTRAYINGSDSGAYALQLSNGGSGNVYTGTFSLSQFGTNGGSASRVFTFFMQAQDNAGNYAPGVTATGSITQYGDNTGPTIHASISPTGTYGAGNDLPNVTITATITDGGTHPSGVNPNSVYARLYVNGSDSGYNLSQPSNGGSGNVYTTTINMSYLFGTNGGSASRVFTFHVYAQDNAYNQAGPALATGSITQINDNAAPKLSNPAVSPQFIPNGGTNITLSVNATDSGGNNTGVSGVRAEVYEDGTDMGYSDLNNATGSTYSVTRDIPAGGTTPHLYKFVFSATDNVGNVSSVIRYAQQAGTNSLPAPTLTAISPATGYTNTGVTLTLTGTNFSKYSVVLFDGFVVPATYKSATSLTCAVDKSFLPSVKQASVKVYNPKPAGGTSAAKTFTINPTLSSLALSPASVAAGGTSTGTVTLSATSPNAQTVTLTSNSAAATVPASVVVPAGQKTATFTITTGTVAASTSVTLTAKLGATKTATLTVTPPTVTLSGLSFATTTVKGGSANATGTVTLSAPAPTGGAVVSVSSNSSSLTLNVTTVTVAAGATTATFRAYSHAVTSTKTATVTATYAGTSKTATVTVTP